MSTQVITTAQIADLEAALNASGDQWQVTADAHPLVAGAFPGTDTLRDTVTLVEAFQHAAGPVQSTLYRNEVTGQWHHTGWSDASQAQIYRPQETDMLTEREDY